MHSGQRYAIGVNSGRLKRSINVEICCLQETCWLIVGSLGKINESIRLKVKRSGLVVVDRMNFQRLATITL
jgi:hypothetical protein